MLADVRSARSLCTIHGISDEAVPTGYTVRSDWCTEPSSEEQRRRCCRLTLSGGISRLGGPTPEASMWNTGIPVRKIVRRAWPPRDPAGRSASEGPTYGPHDATFRTAPTTSPDVPGSGSRRDRSERAHGVLLPEQKVSTRRADGGAPRSRRGAIEPAWSGRLMSERGARRRGHRSSTRVLLPPRHKGTS